jgi:hypothetical protein
MNPIHFSIRPISSWYVCHQRSPCLRAVRTWYVYVYVRPKFSDAKIEMHDDR